MKKLFGVLATALMLMTAQAASATSTFSFSFNGVSDASGPFTGKGLLFSDSDPVVSNGLTSYTLDSASGEFDFGSAGKRTIEALGFLSDGGTQLTNNEIVIGNDGPRAFQMLFTFKDSDYLALFTLVNLSQNASFLFDGDETSSGFTYQIAAVPEPATWAMLILGFAAIGVSLRRRRALAVRFA